MIMEKIGELEFTTEDGSVRTFNVKVDVKNKLLYITDGKTDEHILCLSLDSLVQDEIKKIKLMGVG